MSKFCESCGQKLNDDDNFCFACGSKVRNSFNVQSNKTLTEQINQSNKTVTEQINDGIFNTAGGIREINE